MNYEFDVFLVIKNIKINCAPVRVDEVVPVECLSRNPSISSPIAASSHITAPMS